MRRTARMQTPPEILWQWNPQGTAIPEAPRQSRLEHGKFLENLYQHHDDHLLYYRYAGINSGAAYFSVNHPCINFNWHISSITQIQLSSSKLSEYFKCSSEINNSILSTVVPHLTTGQQQKVHMVPSRPVSAVVKWRRYLVAPREFRFHRSVVKLPTRDRTPISLQHRRSCWKANIKWIPLKFL